MSVFNEKTIKEIIDKATKDKTGRVADTMRKLLEVCEQAGKVGFTLEELSIIGTTGWYISQSPEMGKFFRDLMEVPPPPPDDEFIN